MFFLSTNEVKPNAVPENFKEVIEDHIVWINRKIAEGVVLQAGKWGETRGMVLVKAENLEEARAILQDDPLIASGAVDYILDEYYSNVPLE